MLLYPTDTLDKIKKISRAYWLVKYGMSMVSVPTPGLTNNLHSDKRAPRSDLFHRNGNGSGGVKHPYHVSHIMSMLE